PANRIVCSIINDTTKEILLLLPEHFGYFLEKTGKIQDLIRLMAIGQGVLDTLDKDVFFSANNLTIDMPKDVSDTAPFLTQARTMLDTLASVISQKKIKIGTANTQTSITARLMCKLAWTPHTVFLELCQVYTTLYWEKYNPSDVPYLLAAGLHLDGVFPLQTTK
ncbi:hypothetical protein DP148_27200, partial [Salmonella enterica subsp. enterica serovar Typhimurium]